MRNPWSYIAKNATAIAARVPPTKPSQDFPGEIVGAILCRPIVRPTKYAAVSSANTAIRTVNTTRRPFSGMSRSSTSEARPPPTQTTPSNVSEIAAVAEGRASEKPKTTNATSTVAKMPPTIQETSPTSAPSRVRSEPDVATEYERTEAATHRVELVQSHQPTDEGGREEPPAAEPHDPEDDRQQHQGDDDPRPEGAHRPPNRRSRAANAAERCPQVVGAEVGPERVGEDELGVRRLPEHEVRDPELARRADQQVDLGQVGGVEPRRDRRLVDLVRGEAVVDAAPRRLDELGPAAVVERDPEAERVEIRGLALELCHPLAQVAGDAVAPAEEPGPHALLGEVGQLLVDRLAEDLHQRRHLVRRAGPVLGREGVDGERRDPEVDRGLDGASQRARALAMPCLDGQAAGRCPAAVAVHDDRDRPAPTGASAAGRQGRCVGAVLTVRGRFGGSAPRPP